MPDYQMLRYDITNLVAACGLMPTGELPDIHITIAGRDFTGHVIWADVRERWAEVYVKPRAIRRGRKGDHKTRIIEGEVVIDWVNRSTHQVMRGK